MTSEILYGNDSLNVTIFHTINNIQAPLFQTLAEISSTLGKFSLFPIDLALIALVAWLYGKRLAPERFPTYKEDVKQVFIYLIVAFAVYVVWVGGLKHLLHAPRPFAILPEGSVFIKDNIKAAEPPFVSIPSGHATFSMMMLVCLWPILNKIGKTIGALWVLWIGIARIALGVHFPFDITISYIMSFVITYATVLAARKILMKPLAK